MSTSPEQRKIVWYDIGTTMVINPETPLPAFPAVPRGSIVVLTGRAPIWRYGMALHRLHASSAGVVATYDPRLGAVVVVSHRPGYCEGQVLEVVAPGEA